MESTARILYFDLLAVTVVANFVFDWLLLWATAEVTRSQTTRLRLAVGAALGSFHFTLYLLAGYQVIAYYGLIRFPLTVALISLAMLALTFYPAPWRRILHLAGTFYGILFISAGAGLAAGNLVGSGGQPHVLVTNLVAIGTLLLVAELGWGVVQRRIWREVYLVPVEIACDGRVARVTALMDTGNQLTDPLTQAPVVVVEAGAVESLFPEGLRPDIASLTGGDFSRISALPAQGGWSSRFRVIPFTSLGQDHGLLVGFKPDVVKVLLPEPAAAPRGTIVGLSNNRLDPEGAYRALLHPSLFEEMAASKPKAHGGPVPTVSRLPRKKGEKSIADAGS